MQRCYALFWPRPTHCHTRQRSDLRLLDDDLDLGVPHLIEQDELGCPPCAVWTTAVKGRGKMNVNSSKVSYVAEVVLHELTAWIYEVKELVQ
jgi:hypothetical protein